MARKALAVIAGIIAGAIIVFLVESLSHSVYPPPPGINFEDRDSLENYIQNLPAGAMLFILAAWAGGAFTAGIVSSLISRGRNKTVPLIVGVLFLVAVIMNLIMIPHPLWFAVTGVLIIIPLTFAGYNLAAKKSG